MARTITDSTPKKDGFRFPGEWEKQKQVWVGWPFRTDVWRLGAKPAQKQMAEIIKTMGRYEKVNVCVPREHYKTACGYIGNLENVSLIEMSCDDSWLRDIGPTFLLGPDNEVRGVDWSFQAWGGLEEGFYFPWDSDDLCARKVLEIEGIDRYRTPFILEGGAIYGDGEGTVLVTETSLLDHNQNKMTKEEIEYNLLEYLGAEKIIWLKNGVAYDSVHGHVDLVCCFAAPGELILSWTENEEDENYNLMRENLEALENQVDAKGRKFKITKLHLPNPMTMSKEEAESFDVVEDTTGWQAGDRIAGTYMNFYLGNKCLIMPLCDDPIYDPLALETLKKCFPDREVIGLPARELAITGGCIHCMTQQQPDGR